MDDPEIPVSWLARISGSANCCAAPYFLVVDTLSTENLAPAPKAFGCLEEADEGVEEDGVRAEEDDSEEVTDDPYVKPGDDT